VGHAAAQAGLRVRYFSASDLVETLYRGLADNSVGRVIDNVLRAELVILDELACAPLDATGSQLFFRFVAAAYRAQVRTAIQSRENAATPMHQIGCSDVDSCVRRWAIAALIWAGVDVVIGVISAPALMVFFSGNHPRDPSYWIAILPPNLLLFIVPGALSAGLYFLIEHQMRRG
jgi:hypothetical protein